MSQLALIPDSVETGDRQWVAELMQLVNWGGFHGHVAIGFDADATLLTGASGTGKSTILDAYLALMMPSDTPFNGASNDAAAGRARNPEQRNLLSYLRGKLDDNREAGTGALTDKVLRGNDAPTWGAIAMTFTAGEGRRLTVLRVYHVPRGATAFKDITMKMAAYDGALDLRELEPLAAQRFDKRAMVNRWPAMFIANTYREFEQRIFDRLGVGAGGDGAKALRLLARIQAGHQVRTVDGLYKAMVLETPGTYTAADNAIRHFDDLDASYREMQTAAEKLRALKDITSLWEERARALADEQLIDTFGAGRADDGPYMLWQLRTREQLLEAATSAALEARKTWSTRYHAAEVEEARLRRELARNEEAQREAGGGTEQLKTDIAAAQHAYDIAANRRTRFDQETADLGIDPRTAEDFAAAHVAADLFLTELPDKLAALSHHQELLNKNGWPKQAHRADLHAERTSLTGRAGRVPRRLHEARLAIADAAGIDPAELPFVAELIDIAPGEQDWRKATEVTLYSVARVMLVDERHLQHLSVAIDQIKLPARVQFEGVELRRHRHEVSDDRYISGKLAYKDSPFSWWIRERVTRRGTDHLCVETARALNGDGPRVTRNGQTRNGRRGAHGELADASIIGFSSADRLAEITAEIDALDVELGELARQLDDVTKQAQALQALGNAHRYLQATEWPDIDVDSLQAHITAKQDELARLLESNNPLATLGEEHDRIEADLRIAQREMFGAREKLEEAEKKYAALCELEDETTLAIGRIEEAGLVELTAQQTEYLDAAFAVVGSKGSLTEFDNALPRLARRLSERTLEARERAGAATAALGDIFERFNSRWVDNNRGTDIADYPEYKNIFDSIGATGLAERRAEWRRRLSEWSGQDLVPLAGAFDAALDEIRARLDPVNDILATLPFGPERDRLKISLRALHSDEAVRFRHQLTHLASGVTTELSDAEDQQRFLALREFIDLIRSHDGGTTRPGGLGRDYYLDVRRHVEITALRVGENGREVATYASLGGKSGGETQELMAFIVGSALRYQLGDEDRRPRFAPVFLDEGFIKSDSEFASRAVAAWKRLGFQLVVAAPLDKVTALEPAMPLLLQVTKSRQGYSYVDLLRGLDGEELGTP